MKTNRPTTTLPTPLSSPVDILLADIAIRVQLSRSDYDIKDTETIMTTM